MEKIIKNGGSLVKQPPFRKLRGYAFDPSLSQKMETASINNLTYKIPWENLEHGPIGEYVEIIDFDPTIKKFYKPVNLDENYVLAQDGLDPSESNPLFHQQMTYTVAMTTINNFEKALGRKILWSPRRISGNEYERYVPKLRIYPHAFREANAYYSPLKKALLFGYFSANPADETLLMPDSLVFTCLSHDIIAHETTHAILDGMHNYYNEPTNPDVLAFHEAFADLVALFQHFTFPEVLRSQIAKSKGDLTSQNLLGELAQEFGTAIGNYGSLRDAIGEIDETTNKWKPRVPNPNDYRTILEPHSRGSILVAAIFDAFINIYKGRTKDLLRIASDGTGILKEGELHPDLVNRLSDEAAKAASHVLNMCIRAIDYCPPVDITFGDYLRAIITADLDLVADDNRDYRLAFIDSFRRRGIYPEHIKTLSVESLSFPILNIGYATDKNGRKFRKENENLQVDEETKKLLGIINGFLKEFANKMKYVNDREEIYNITKKYTGSGYESNDTLLGLHKRIKIKFSGSPDFARITGLAFNRDFFELGVKRSDYSGPSFQIQNLRVVSRVGPNNNQINHVVFSIVQTAKGVFNDGQFVGSQNVPNDQNSVAIRGGCTLIFDLDSMKLKYSISKPLIDVNSITPNGKANINTKRLAAQSRFKKDLNNDSFHEYELYFGGNDNNPLSEPFAFLHQH